MDADRRQYDVGSKTPVPYARFAAAVNLPHTGRFVKQSGSTTVIQSVRAFDQR
jgi:hypothetical protein